MMMISEEEIVASYSILVKAAGREREKKDCSLDLAVGKWKVSEFFFQRKLGSNWKVSESVISKFWHLEIPKFSYSDIFPF